GEVGGLAPAAGGPPRPPGGGGGARRRGGGAGGGGARPPPPRPFPSPAPAGSVIIAGMSEVTRILSAIEGGDASAAEQLLPLVYDELRQLAAQRLARERPGQTLQATALVHEAYLRLVGAGPPPPSQGPRPFFPA